MENERELPIRMIKRTAFEVDADNFELREKGNPSNVMQFTKMNYRGFQYEFAYDRKIKNFANLGSDIKDVSFIDLPCMTVLDGKRLAEKSGLKISEVRGLSDFFFFNDQDLLKRRLSGELPQLQILDHPFYVDVRMGSLRPKDDFSTEGIVFKNLPTPNGDTQRALYDPSRHTTVDLDVNKILEAPKNLVVIEFPPLVSLDPVGSFCKHNGMTLADLRYPGIERGYLEKFLMQYPVKELQPAKIVPWEDTGLQQVIDRNKERQAQHASKMNKTQDSPAQQKRRGMGM